MRRLGKSEPKSLFVFIQIWNNVKYAAKKLKVYLGIRGNHIVIQE